MPLYHTLLPASIVPSRNSIYRSLFHTRSSWSQQFANHYQTLGLESNASLAAIKQQFYSLSKAHHPDHNPNDPEASSRFVKISEAYATLGNAQKRERYDRDFRRAAGGPVQQEFRGSHSSSSTPWGSRPASGLSRRRTQFRGPPPSFYRSGGWGAQSAKRQSQAESAAGASGATVDRGGSSGLGQGQAGWGNDVPHFDRDGHYRTQEQQESRRRRRRKDQAADYGGVPGVWINFVVIGGVVSLASLPFLLFERRQHTRLRNQER